ncbi:MAG TPA: hypothetical protein VI456_02490 [Polyangia bacterium]
MSSSPTGTEPQRSPYNQPGPGLWMPGVAMGSLWLIAAFLALFGCFAVNYFARPPMPQEELQISNAAMGVRS